MIGGSMAAGLPVRRPDQDYDPPQGNLPAGSPNIFRGRLVIIFGTGTGTGLFMYSGFPALGNPPILAITTASVDPYGNTVTASALSAALPLLMYNPALGAGNLFASIAPVAGTDGFADGYQAGITSYGSPATIFAQLLAGELHFSQANYLSVAKIISNALGGMQMVTGTITGNLQAGNLSLFPGAVPGPALMFLSDLQQVINDWPGGITGPALVGSSWSLFSDSAGVLHLLGSHATSGDALTVTGAGTTADVVMNGNAQVGSSNGPGFIAATDPAAAPAAETFHAMNLASGSGNWQARGAGFATPSYRLLATGDVELAGELSTINPVSSGDTIAVLPPAYRNGSHQYTLNPAIISGGVPSSTAQTVRISYTTAGQLQINGITAASSPVVSLDGLIIPIGA